MRATRDILVISPNFPPLGNPRAIQVGRMVKVLGAAGFSVDVIASGGTSGQPRNAHGACAAVEDPAIDVVPFEQSPARRGPVAARLYRLFRPADAFQFYGPLNSAVQELLATRSYRHVLSVAEPLVSHQVAVGARRFAPDARFSFIFSDPVPTEADHGMMKLRMRRNSVHRLAKRCTDVGKLCMAPTREILDHIGSEGAAEMMVVPHCFDPRDWKDTPEAEAGHGSRPITVLHAGALYYRRRPDILMGAVAALRARSGADLRIRFLGYADPATVTTAKRRRYGEFVSFEPGVPFEQARQAMLAADILCVVDCSLDRNVHLPSKVADYVAARKPILYIGQTAAPTARLLRDIHPLFRQAEGVEEAVAGLQQLALRSGSLPGEAFRASFESLRMENVYAPLVRYFAA